MKLATLSASSVLLGVLLLALALLPACGGPPQPPGYTIKKPDGWLEMEKKEGAGHSRLLYSEDQDASVVVTTIYPVKHELHEFADYMEKEYEQKTGASLGDKLLDSLTHMDSGLPELVREYAQTTAHRGAMHMTRIVYIKWESHLYMVAGMYASDGGHEAEVEDCMASFALNVQH